jgi:hypothetical protein
MFERDADAGYFFLGTAGHAYIEARLAQDMNTDQAFDYAWAQMEGALAESAEAGREVRWTKKRTADSVLDDLSMLAVKWEESYEPMYGDFELVAVEVPVSVTVDGTVIATTIDAVFQTDAGLLVVDWKTGATAKANPTQLHIYSYAYRHSLNEFVPEEDVDLRFHHVAFKKQQTAMPYPGDEYVAGLLNWASSQKEAMVADGFAPAKQDWWCDYCLYRDNCPVFDGDLGELRRRLVSATIELTPQEGTT